MDANQRSEVNNQTDNVANTKWTPGAKGKTADSDQPLDHTYPNGAAVQQMGSQGPGSPGTQQSGAGVDGDFDRSDALNASTVPGGSMESQVNGGSGAVQGITDSHQRAMEDKSAAYGELEQPVGGQPNGGGVDVSPHHDAQRDAARHRMNAQNPAQPDLQGGSLGAGQGGAGHGNRQSGTRGTTEGGGMAGPLSRQSSSYGSQSGSMGNRQSANPGAPRTATQGGGMPGPRGPQGHDGEEAQAGNTQRGVAGSASATNRNSDAGGVHASNDLTGGLPRSPGNSGPQRAGSSTDRAGSQTGAGTADRGPADQESNDAAGGYPRSPGYANRLAGDSNMDDDTGFKRKP